MASLAPQKLCGKPDPEMGRTGCQPWSRKASFLPDSWGAYGSKNVCPPPRLGSAKPHDEQGAAGRAPSGSPSPRSKEGSPHAQLCLGQHTQVGPPASISDRNSTCSGGSMCSPSLYLPATGRSRHVGRGGHRTEQEGPHLPQTLALPAQHPDHRLHSQNHDVPSSLDWYHCPPTHSPAPITFSLSLSSSLCPSPSLSPLGWQRLLAHVLNSPADKDHMTGTVNQNHTFSLNNMASSSNSIQFK